MMPIYMTKRSIPEYRALEAQGRGARWRECWRASRIEPRVLSGYVATVAYVVLGFLVARVYFDSILAAIILAGIGNMVGSFFANQEQIEQARRRARAILDRIDYERMDGGIASCAREMTLPAASARPPAGPPSRLEQND
jgi:hypothetical protein